MKRIYLKLFTTLIAVAMTLTLTACGGGKENTTPSGNADTPVSSEQTDQVAQESSESAVEFPELTPLVSWKRVNDFIKANAPTSLAEYYELRSQLYSTQYETLDIDNFTYDLNRELKLAVGVGYVGPEDYAGELVLPAEVEGCRVIEYQPKYKLFGEYSLPEGVSSLTIEDGVLAVLALDGANISTLSLPSSVVSIWGSFENCPLSEVELPASLCVLLNSFSSTQITELVIPENVIFVDGFARTPLTSVTFKGEHVLAFYSWAFYSCRQLTDFEIPSSVLYVHDMAFKDSPISVPEELIFNIYD